VSAELLVEYPEAEIDLIAGGGGIFEVKVDDDLVYKKSSGANFPAPGEVGRAIGKV